MATEAQDNQLLIEAWCMMAYALNVNDRYVDALPYYRQAIRALDLAGDEKRAASLRLGFIFALSLAGQSREALVIGHEASRFFRKHQDLAAQAKLATNLGLVHERLDDRQQALGYHSEAADLFRQIGDERSLAQVYHNLGITYCFLDRFAESEEMYQQCESLSSRLGLWDLHAQSRYNKAYLYFMSGRLSEALALFREVRSACSQNRCEAGSRRPGPHERARQPGRELFPGR